MKIGGGDVIIRSTCNIAGLVAALFLAPALALAQITAGTVTGWVLDPSGAIVAGARVDLISETQGIKTAAVITNATGGCVIPNLIEGAYRGIENELAGGNESGISTDPPSNRLTALPTFPELYPDAGEMNTGTMLPGHAGDEAAMQFYRRK
jgi:hypothetical protein